MTSHVRAQLSAYLDGALSVPQRAAVEAHLDVCADCRARLGELRATATLIGRLSDPVPARRLVPRVAPPPAWLAPLRTLSTIASGVSVFLFIASALLGNMQSLTGTTAGAPAERAVPAAGAAAPQSSGLPAPSGRGAAPALPTGPSAALNAADAAKQASPSASPGAFAANAANPTPTDGSTALEARSDRALPSLVSPWLWLGLAVVTGVLAIALQRRLRSA